ncbi:MAG: M23 family metallopeptidase [Gemmatimonadota bacterium]|nr:M23 family metallopeptidase [Gemmatimonadota bacterium]
MSHGGARWTILVVRPDDVDSHRFALTRGRILLGVVAVLAVLAAAAAAGRWSALRERPAQIAALEARIDSLHGEALKVARLAATLEQLEASYARLRAVMSGEVLPSARDILLPAVEPGGQRSAPADGSDTGRPALWPLVESGFVTRTFGDSAAGATLHRGLDIAVPSGSYIRASGAGRVVEAGEDREYGRFVRLEHGDGVRSLYAHASWVLVAPGDEVEAGDVIALSGNTGRSTAPHLHLEIERNGEPVDPLPWVTGRL